MFVFCIIGSFKANTGTLRPIFTTNASVYQNN